MKKLFLGFCFLFLELTLHFGSDSFPIIPSFIGYILIYMGLCELPFWKETEQRPRHMFLAVLELGWFGWLVYNTFFAPSHDDRAPFIVGAKLLLVVIAYFAAKKLLAAFSACEEESGILFHTQRLCKVLKIATILTLVGNALTLLTYFDLPYKLTVLISLVSALAIAAGHIATVVFLTLLYLDMFPIRNGDAP